jgi:hypothetical protein
MLIQGAALAGGQQGRGRRVTATQSPAAQPEPIQADVQDNTPSAAAQNGERSFANPLLDAKFIRFDVAENARRFVFDETPLFPDGAPAYGNEFVTEGYIYPAGTLNSTNGVNEDGSPEFPDQVIGRWVCRGWHVGEGAKTAKLVDLNVPIQRAIIGGTGPFAEARGEATQTMIGFNQLNGVNLRFTIRVVTKR